MIEPAKRALEKLENHRSSNAERRIDDLFDADAKRFGKFSAKCGNILFDYSKNNLTDETLDHLIDLSQAAELPQKRQALFDGGHVNITEDRAVQHMALRQPDNATVMIDGVTSCRKLKKRVIE